MGQKTGAVFIPGIFGGVAVVESQSGWLSPGGAILCYNFDYCGVQNTTTLKCATKYTSWSRHFEDVDNQT